MWPNDESKEAYVQAGDYAGSDIVCHVNASPASDVVEVQAGDPINLQWSPWPTSHIGPILTYLAPAGDDFSKVDKANLKFIKTEETGLIHNSTDPGTLNGYYASNKLMDSGNKWTTTIPSFVKPGNYILRTEIIALMGAKTLGRAQHYPQCINVKVTGNGNDPISNGIRAQDFYKATDPGIQIMIYKDLDYKIPGPPVYKGNGAAPVAAPEPVASSEPVAAASAEPEAASAPAASVPQTTLVSVPSPAPHHKNNATAFPSFHYKPWRTPAATSIVPSEPSKTPAPHKSYDYSYGSSDWSSGKSDTKGDAPKTSYEPTEDTSESDSTKTSGAAPASPATGHSDDTPEPAPTTEPGHSFTPPVKNTQTPPTTPAPVVDDYTTSLLAEDFDLPKNASLDQLVAFLEKLLAALKDKVLGGKRKYARDFSMH